MHMTESQPGVSVVIPTRNRPHDVQRAISSALQQTFQDLEVVVVVDGPDEVTVNELREITDTRVRVVALPESVGGSEARNTGVREARGEYIAFLDDDDEFFSEKIEKQIQRARASRAPYPLVVCYFILRAARLDTVWPRRLPRPNEPISEYLFCRSSFTRGEGAFQTSTFFCPRQLLLETPFQKGLKRHQDWDWLLRIGQRKDVAIEAIEEPLSVYHWVPKPDRVSTNPDWEFSLRWAQENRDKITPRAYSFFIAAEMAPMAAALSPGAKTFFRLFREYLKGSPTPFALALFLGYYLFPESLRTRVRTSYFLTKAKLQRAS